jgi:hypothetical protein
MVNLITVMAVVAVVARWSGSGGGGGGGRQLAAKAAGNESLNGRFLACNDKSGQNKTMQQPTNDGRIKGGRW